MDWGVSVVDGTEGPDAGLVLGYSDFDPLADFGRCQRRQRIFVPCRYAMCISIYIVREYQRVGLRSEPESLYARPACGRLDDTPPLNFWNRKAIDVTEVVVFSIICMRG